MSTVKKPVKSNAKVKKPFTRIPDEVRARIVKHLKETGCSYAQAKIKFGVTAHAISRIFKEAGGVRSAPAAKAKPAGKPAAKPAGKGGAGAKAVAAVKGSKPKPAPAGDEGDVL